MKLNYRVSLIAVALTGALAATVFVGCAEMEAHNTRSLLSASGFQTRTPQNARQKEIYDALPAYHVERITYKGKTLYAYKDESAGVAYVGREPEYQSYRRLCIQQQVAQDYYMAAQMNSMYASRWYGAWGW